MDLGFPTCWAAKDTVVVVAAVAAVLITAFAIYLQTRADALADAASEIDQWVAREDDTARQFRIAQSSTMRRAAKERSRFLRSMSSAAFVVAVLVADVTSLPWVVFPVLIVTVCLALFAFYKVRRFEPLMKRRLDILSDVWKLHSASLNGPYIGSPAIRQNIDAVFGKDENAITQLERNMLNAFVLQAKDRKAYDANRRNLPPPTETK